jgi:hypothetical protein
MNFALNSLMGVRRLQTFSSLLSIATNRSRIGRIRLRAPWLVWDRAMTGNVGLTAAIS